jgi:glycosyltransferase involved in cell wall biosynthesis
MKKSVDKIIITNLPSFYKINLYNEIAKQINILVIYTFDHAQGRNNDFYSGDMRFEHIFLSQSTSKRIRQLFGILHNTDYKEIIIGGWDSISMWLSAMVSQKQKNALVIESSYIESSTSGIKGLIKRLFLSRITKVYASGLAQRKISDNLGFKGETIITKGVGVFNYIKQPPYTPREEVRRFLYVGRLVAVKNIEFIIDKFNKHPELELTIIGFGELEEKLKAMAKDNIKFLGAVDNKDLYKHYQRADVFILPSKSEAWGLVVEEALNNGTPVMISNKVGCSEEIINSENGVIFSLDSDDFEEQLSKIRDIQRYNKMREYISKMDFDSIEKQQVNCYI